MNSTPTAFVISPIGKPGSEAHRRHKLTLDYIIKKALEPEWEVVRADDESSPDSISTQIIERIDKSDLIVAVLTDHNPNVFYELAVAHGLKKPVVHLLQDGQEMPFDVGDQRAIFYDLADPESVDTATSSLQNSVVWVRENPGKLRNPLTSYAQFNLVAESGSNSGEVVADALQEITQRLAALERTMGRGSRRSDSLTELFYRDIPMRLRHAVRKLSATIEESGMPGIAVVLDDTYEPEKDDLRIMRRAAQNSHAELVSVRFVDGRILHSTSSAAADVGIVTPSGKVVS
ncbi:nucleoside 2-deoxyribosyltransferase [Microbacterium sp. No. 7]|uniref:hypothetical protein n=1 Tax=Microbacterium sp. No. 7 TaxID=1714373 RepID=UPI00300A1D9B